jgi:hypothetical protein
MVPGLIWLGAWGLGMWRVDHALMQDPFWIKQTTAPERSIGAKVAVNGCDLDKF